MKFYSLESDPVLALNVLPAVDGVGVEPVGDAGGGAVDVLAGHCLKTIGNGCFKYFFLCSLCFSQFR